MQKRQSISPELRAALLRAYKNACQYCEGDKKGAATQVDHIIPLKNKGKAAQIIESLGVQFPNNNLNCLENLMAACQPCNVQKTNNILPISLLGAMLALAKRTKPIILADLEQQFLRKKHFRIKDKVESIKYDETQWLKSDDRMIHVSPIWMTQRDFYASNIGSALVKLAEEEGMTDLVPDEDRNVFDNGRTLAKIGRSWIGRIDSELTLRIPPLKPKPTDSLEGESYIPTLE